MADEFTRRERREEERVRMRMRIRTRTRKRDNEIIDLAQRDRFTALDLSA